MALDRPKIAFTVKDLVIDNDLTVNGTTTTLSATNTVISDKLMELANGTSGTPSGDAGIIVERGSSTNAGFVWDESADTWVACTTSATGASTGDLTLTPAKVSASDATLTSTSTQLTLKYDADSSATVTVDGSSNTTIATAESGDIILDAPDQIHLDSDGGMWKLLNGGALKAYIQDDSSDIVIHNETQDNDIKFSGNDGGSGITALTLDMSEAGLAKFNSSVSMKEKAAAETDTAAYGQLWVKTATPNELYFTTDAGNDIQLTSGTSTAGGGASALDDLSDVSYGSGDLVITSLDKLTTSVAAHDTAGTAVVLKGGDTTAGTTNNIAGGSLTLQGGQGKGSGAGGDIIFQTANAGGSGSSLNSLATALTLSDDLSATFTGAVTANAGVSVDNITIDGDDIILSTGPLDIQAAGGLIMESTSQSIVLDAYTGQVQIKKDGTSEMTFTAGDIEYSNNQNATVSIEATAHDAAGRSLTITAGPTTAATTNNIAGGSLTLQGGVGKGSGAGGDIIFQTANAGGSGSSMNTLATALTISDDLSSTFVGIVDITDATDSTDDTGDTGALRCEGGASIAKKLWVGSDVNFTGENFYTGKFISHYGDTDTRIVFFNAGDIIALEAGGVEFLKCHETTQDELIVNSLSGDVDFRVVSDDESHMLFVDANNNRVSIGDSTDAPAATLEVTNHATAGAYNVPLVQMNSNDTDQIALDINAANITANVVDITAAGVTANNVLMIQADGLTSGNAINCVSNSADTTARSLISLKNDHTSAVNVTGIALVNDAPITTATAVFSAAMGDKGSAVGLKVKEKEITLNTGGTTTDDSGFIPANCIPIALGMRVTQDIQTGDPAPLHIDSVGLGADADAFMTLGTTTLQDNNNVAVVGISAIDPAECLANSARQLRIVCSGTPAQGKIRVALYYYEITPPTS